MTVTNAERADLIDALAIAIENLRSYIDSSLPPGSHGAKARKLWSEQDRADYDEWSGQIPRFRKLRRRLLAEEKAA